MTFGFLLLGSSHPVLAKKHSALSQTTPSVQGSWIYKDFSSSKRCKICASPQKGVLGTLLVIGKQVLQDQFLKTKEQYLFTKSSNVNLQQQFGEKLSFLLPSDKQGRLVKFYGKRKGKEYLVETFILLSNKRLVLYRDTTYYLLFRHQPTKDSTAKDSDVIGRYSLNKPLLLKQLQQRIATLPKHKKVLAKVGFFIMKATEMRLNLKKGGQAVLWMWMNNKKGNARKKRREVGSWKQVGAKILVETSHHTSKSGKKSQKQTLLCTFAKNSLSCKAKKASQALPFIKK
jgi:hypothetical protein